MYKKHHYSNQHGMATLAMTVILLFVMTLVTLYVAKTSIKEQQISANQYRADQSLSTANAALDWGVAYYSKALGRICKKDTTKADCVEKSGICILNETLVDIIDNNESAECEFIYNEDNILNISPDVTESTYYSNALSIGRSEMHYAFVESEVDKDCNNDGDFNDECKHIPVDGGALPDIYKTPIRIYGLGHSDDDTGRRTISVTIDTGNVFGEDGPGGLTFPLIAKSLITDNTGGLTVINRYVNRTISSGDGQTLSGNTHTYVAKPGTNCHDYANRAVCINMEPELATDMEASEGKDKVNSDIIDGNTNLSNLTDDQFFINFFGKEKTVMEDFIDDVGEVFPNTKDWGELVAGEETLIWIDGEYTPSGSAGETLGSDANPVVLIVNGDLKSGGNINIIGILYVIGEWSPSSNNTVRGIVITEGGLSGTGAGGATIVYDGDLLKGGEGPPPGTVAAAVPGSWRDW